MLRRTFAGGRFTTMVTLARLHLVILPTHHLQIVELDKELGTEENMKVEKVSRLINGQEEFSRITSSAAVVMVNFFAPWCHWCQLLAPIYEGVAQRVQQGPLQSNVVVAKVDCTNAVNFPICHSNRIQAYPTVIM